MPENQPVYSASDGRPAGHLPIATPDEAYVQALLAERAGYTALLDGGQTQRGGEPIADILDRIDGELTRLGHITPVPAEFLGEPDSPRFEPVDVPLADNRIGPNFGRPLEQEPVADDVPPPRAPRKRA